MDEKDGRGGTGKRDWSESSTWERTAAEDEE